MPEQIPAWAQWLGAGGGGAVLMKAADVLMGRKGREVAVQGEVIDRLAARLEKTEERLETVEQHKETCEQRLDAAERALSEHKALLERAMNGRPLPAYHLNQGVNAPGRGAGK